MFEVMPSTDTIRRKNAEIYDDTSGVVWRLAVYPVHDGWEFINLGGAELLDRIAAGAGMSSTNGTGASAAGMSDTGTNTGTPRETRALELCSGQGAACRYLASRYGWIVDGVEMNAGQVARARQRLDETDVAIASRVRILQDDVLRFTPTRPYDIVYSLDSLMLIPDVPAALRVAASALSNGGELAFATIAAGAAIDEPMRRFAWECDGMITLATADEYRTWLAEAGFTDIRVEDSTDLAVRRSVELEQAILQHREPIVRAESEPVFRGWIDVGAIYLDALESRKLSYPLIRARRPADAAAA